jgi:hypothetical protein
MMSMQITRHVDIPLIASDAAIELDELLVGENPSLSNFQHLVRVLPKLLSPNEKGLGGIHPAAVVVVSRAFDDANWSVSMNTAAELAREAAHLAAGLQSAQGDSRTEYITKVRDFCLALANTAISYGQSFEDVDSFNDLK